jgi:hypothetical protein
MRVVQDIGAAIQSRLKRRLGMTGFGKRCAGRVVRFFIHASLHRLATLVFVGSVISSVAGLRTAAAVGEIVVAAASDDLSFAIPGQSLEGALMLYAEATGVEVFVDHALIVGRRSAAVQGVYGFDAALRLMLTGTGLSVLRAAPRAYTLVADAHEPELDRVPAWSGDITQSRFFAALQTAVKQALCAEPEIAPGSYRAALAIRINATGHVVEARLLGTDVDGPAGRRLVDGIKSVSVGQAPPAGLEQPITFVILPRQTDQTGDCASQQGR